jgi:pimeloyl-ACP methyl ester carboxylesterase
MKSIEVASRNFFFEDAQPEGTESTATIVFVHGAGGSHKSWRYQLKYLSDRFRIIAVDLPGHGMSGGEGEETIGEYARYLTALMDALELENVVLGGHSMGGAIALKVALENPDRLGGLLLVGTGARLRVMPMIFSMIKDDFDAAVEGMGSSFFGPAASEDIMNEEKRLLAKSSPDVMLQDFTACDSFDVINELSSISLLTLILCGNQDSLTPVKYSEFLHDKIENSEVVFFDNCGHMPMVEQSVEFNEAVASFLTRLQ